MTCVRSALRKKLLGQIVAACVAATAGLLIGNIVNPFIPGAEIDLGWFAYPITVIYLVAFTNIINLIDGLDGLAAGISGIASLSMFSFAVLAGASRRRLSRHRALWCVSRLPALQLPSRIHLHGRFGVLALGLWPGHHLAAQRESNRGAHLAHHPAHRRRRSHPRHPLRHRPSQARAREHWSGGQGPHPPPPHPRGV